MPHDNADSLSGRLVPLILVVDDEPTPRSIVTRMVRGLGYPARGCSSGRAALRYLGEHPREVRVLLADLGMPRMDGGELAERARDLDPALQVVLMVAAGNAHLDELLAGYPDVPVLAKPVSFGDLYRTLGDLLGAPSRAARYPPSMGPPARNQRRSPGRRDG
jgi:two-component system cell cycle response regulator CpdR